MEAMSAVNSQGGCDLVPVHGGLAQPVDRVVPLSERRAFLREAEKLPSIRVDRADVSTVHRLADGGLSPLDGPMRGEVWHRVLEERRILVDGRPYAWSIPLSLPVADDEAGALGVAHSTAWATCPRTPGAMGSGGASWFERQAGRTYRSATSSATTRRAADPRV